MSSTTTDSKHKPGRSRIPSLAIFCLPAIFALIVVIIHNLTGGHFDLGGSPSLNSAFAEVTDRASGFPDSVLTTSSAATTVETQLNQRTVYFSVDRETSFDNGLTIANEDIAARNDNGIHLFFDGSDVGLAKYKINSLSVIKSDQILLTFSETAVVAGIERPVQPTDIVRFSATESGEKTVGTFDLYFVGENVGLDTPSENIDAIDSLSDGRLVISTVSSFSVPLAVGNDEDLIVFSPTALGMATAGSWKFYLDGSDIEWKGQDVDGLAIDDDGHVYLSGNRNFTPSMGSVSKSDIIRFTPKSLGDRTAGSYLPELVLDGSQLSLDARNVKGLDVRWELLQQSTLPESPVLPAH